MEQLTVFNYNAFPVRTLQKGSEVWWVLADVCKVLGLSNSRKAATQIDDDEKDVTLSDTLGGQQKMTIINEPGLYSLIFRSNKPEAKQFKRWVTHEVLPMIRQTGSYGSEEQYDKMEIAKIIASCKSVGAVKAVMSLFDLSGEEFHIPANAKNSVTLFLREYTESDLTESSQKDVYSVYENYCRFKDLVPSTLTNFSRELHRQTGLIVKRYRVDGKLVGFYRREK